MGIFYFFLFKTMVEFGENHDILQMIAIWHCYEYNMRNKNEQQSENSRRSKKLNPIDDLMFRTMAEDKEFCEEILRVILQDEKLVVLESTVQYAGTNPQGRSVILDAKCVLGDERKIDIEVQKRDEDDHQRRVRYNGAILTTNITDPGEKFQDVPDVCVVFISKFDIFNGNHSLYHVDRIIRETGEKVDNGFEESMSMQKSKTDQMYRN